MDTIRLTTPGATEAFGRALAGRLRCGDIIALSGALGAGKTVLARGVLRGLGHGGDVASPTFAIVVPYDSPEMRLPAWHVDLYRVEQAAELGELGLDEARQDGVLLIEWPERIPALWPETLKLALAAEPDGARALTADVPPAWGARWPPR
jgi:tRNA threonylcarbamoyladenosine biosynthesis protein TsaE